MKEPEIAVIINSFNRLPLLKKSLTSLKESFENSGLSYVITIFEAGSTDGSLEYIREFIEKNPNEIILITAKKGEPSSFSHGVNRACEEVVEKYHSVKYFFLYETDNFIQSITPVKNAIQLIAENTNIAGCGFTVKKHNGSSAGYGCKFPSVISLLAGQQLAFKMKLNEEKPIWKYENGISFFYSNVVYTSPVIIKRNSWESVSGFDAENFPFSDCDIDLAYRLNLRGQKLIVMQSHAIIHDNLDIGSQWSATRTLNFYRARFTYFVKHKGSWVKAIIPFMFMTHLAEFFAILFLVIFKKRSIQSLDPKFALIKKVWNGYK